MKKLKLRPYQIVLFALGLVAASFYVFYATNLLMCDVLNYATKGVNFPIIIATFPYLLLAIEIVTFFIFLVRYVRMDNIYRAHHIKVYSVQLLVYSLLGIILTIVTGTYVYGSFVKPYPFAGATIIILVIHIILLLASITSLIINRKIMSDESERLIFGPGHVFMSAAMGLLTYFAFNRFGAFIWSFIFTDYNHFFLTLPIYISLIVPMVILIALTNRTFGLFGKNPRKQEIITWSVLSGVSIAFTVMTILMCSSNSLIVSLISGAMPLERLASLPIESIALFGTTIVTSVVNLILAIKSK